MTQADSATRAATEPQPEAPRRQTNSDVAGELDDEQRQDDYMARYREQMERLQCPGCGEAQFF
jgi:hypothetical protein